MTVSTFLASLILAISPASTYRCSVRTLRENPEGYFYQLAAIRRIVADAEVIARVTAIDSARGESLQSSRSMSGSVVFRVEEVLRGSRTLDTLRLPGRLVSHDDFNTGAVPYRMVRSAGQRGDCYATEYRRGAEYLLLLKSDRRGLSPWWAPLAPVNEQLRGARDAWLVWVRREINRASHPH